MNITIADVVESQAKCIPEKKALVYRESVFSYGALHGEVGRVASLLRDHGLAKSDRVAVFMEKSPEEAVSLLAACRAGGIFVDVNHLLKGLQVEHILRDSGARFLMTTCQRLHSLAPLLGRCTDLETIIVHGPGNLPDGIRQDVVGRDSGRGISDRGDRQRMVETDVGAIIYTSGSTGKPKGVVLSHRNLMAGAESVSTYVENVAEDRILSVLPFSFDYGLNQLTTSLLTGATCVLMNYLFPNDILNAMEKYEITGLGLIPPLWLQILQKDWDYHRFPNWRYLTNTGGALPVTAVRSLRQRLPKSKIYLMFGLTEAFRGTYLPPDQVDNRPGSIGKAIPNAEIWLLNNEGKHCRPGEEGELVQRGAHVAMGYWNDLEKTAERFRPNPFSPPELQIEEKVVFSGDTVWKDDEGFIYYKGRSDEMIKTSGYRVSPSEVEEVLYATGRVKHAAAFGIADDFMGQVVAAAVSPKAGERIAETDLIKACMQKLPGYMVPKQVEIWDELPVNPNGKIDRKTIKTKFGIQKHAGTKENEN